jgi:hypothetical protein
MVGFSMDFGGCGFSIVGFWCISWWIMVDASFLLLDFGVFLGGLWWILVFLFSVPLIININ